MKLGCCTQLLFVCPRPATPRGSIDLFARGLPGAVLLCLVVASTCGAQTGSLALSSASATPGSTVSLNLSLSTASGSLPSALQWTLNYPSSGITSLTTTAGSAASAAGKSVTCSGNNCVLYGLNEQTVSSGVVAVLNFQLATNASGNLSVQLTGVDASSAQGSGIGMSETGGVISIGSGVNVSVTPASVTLDDSQTQQCTATVTGTSNTAVTWSLSPNMGTISSAGLYTAPASISTQQTVMATATSVADPTRQASAAITLMPVVVSLSPATATLLGGQSQQFTAAVTNATNTAVTWSISPNTGSISTAGLYTAPASVTTQQAVTVTAASVADPSKVATAAITLTPATAQAVTFVQEKAVAKSSASSASIAFKQNTKAGDLIMVGIDYDTNGTATSVTDSQGNVYTEVGTELSSPGGTRTRVYYARNIKGGADTVKVVLSANSSFFDIYLTEYSGASQTNPIDAQSGATGAAGSVSSGYAGTTTAGDLIFGFCVGDSVCSAASGYNVRSTLVTNLVEDQKVGNPGSYAATGSANQGWTMQMVALRPGP